MTKAQTQPTAGIAQEVIPGIRCLLAPNPAPMTYWGTNTFLLGTDPVVVVDPGPDMDAHLSAILAATHGARIEAILITHSHKDHSPLAPRLSKLCGAPIMAYGNSTSGRAPHMTELARITDIGGGEGVDADFSPDQTLADSAQLNFGCGQLEALWTPGHFGNHMCFALDHALISGDLVMGWASSLVSPPDGDLSHFMESCERLLTRSETLYLPGHGDMIRNGKDRAEWLLDHRRSRGTQILNALSGTPLSAKDIADRIYTDTPERLMPAAARNVFAHLIDLWAKDHVTCTGTPTPTSKFKITQG